MMIEDQHTLKWEAAVATATQILSQQLAQSSTKDAVAWLAASQQPLLATLESLTDLELDRLRRTNWGEEWPTHRLFKTLVTEQVHHGAEVSLLRDLYRNRATLGAHMRDHDSRVTCSSGSPPTAS
jgi:hypothetical protein